MFCPKCASKNADEAKYCRGCGADLSNVLAVVEGRPANVSPYAERHIELFSLGLRGLIIGFGFLLVSGISFAVSTRLTVLAVFALAFASFFLGTGISRFVQARGIRKLYEPKDAERSALSTGDQQYIQFPRSIYQTDDLLTPRSVTENTTRHLSIDESTRDRD